MDSTDIGHLLNALPFPAACLAENGRIEAINGLLATLYPAAAVGKPFAIVMRQPAVVVAAEAALDRGETRRVAINMQSAGREMRWHVSASPLEGNARPRRALLVFEDRSALEETAQIRRDFVANVSHELRSPLTALTGFIETLKSTAQDDPAARARFLDIMEREANRMSRLVLDLLALSRVEANERLRPEATVDLSEIIAGVLSVIGPAAARAGVEIRRQGLDAPLRVTGDNDQLRQVFTNLIENAVKYGGSGGQVCISSSRISHEPTLRCPAVRIDVTDRGDGFDPIHIPRLTERFYRIDTHRSREKGGTGLGLAIVKHIVNRHRGRLMIESASGKGSRFSVILPE